MNDAKLNEFRAFLDQRLPEGTAHISDADLAGIRRLMEMVGDPAAAAGLIAQIDALLEAGDSMSLTQLCESMGAKFESVAEAKSYLQQFRALLVEGPTRKRRG